MGEKKLVSLFPCFSLLIEQYNEKIFAKRSKLERNLIQDGKVESKSMIETKGRMVTSAGQFFLLLQKISPNGTIRLEDLFEIEKIKVYIRRQANEYLAKKARSVVTRSGRVVNQKKNK